MTPYETGYKLERLADDFPDRELVAEWCRGVWQRHAEMTGEAARQKDRADHPASFGVKDFLKSMNGKKP